MIAISGGLLAAVMWASSALCTSRSTRMIPTVSVLGWVLAIGALASAPFALADGVPEALGFEHVWWLVAVSIGSGVGLLLVYSSLRFGKVGVVAPITSAQGAAAALIAVFAGEQLSRGTGITLGAIIVGVVLASSTRAKGEDAGDRREGLAIAFAVGAAALFGVALYAMGRLAEDLPVAWILFPPRVLGALVLTVPLAAMGELRLTRPALPLVVASGILEMLGLVAYNIGARHGIAVTAILASQFAAIAAVGAFFLFRERLTHVQVAGIVVIALSVAVLTGLRA